MFNKRKITKRGAVLGGVGAVVAGGAIAAAVVLLTATGSGSGVIIAGSNGGGAGGGGTTGVVSLSVDPLGVTGGFIPGGTAETVNLDASNGNGQPVLVTTVTYGGVSSPNGACEAVITADPSQFQQVPNSVTENTTVPALTTDFALPNPVALRWINVPGLDQTPCGGQPLVLTENTP